MEKMDRALKAWNIQATRAGSGDIPNDPMFFKSFDKLQNDLLMIGNQYPKNSVEKMFSTMLYLSLFISDDDDVVSGTVDLLRRSVESGQTFKSMAQEFKKGFDGPKLKLVKQKRKRHRGKNG